MVSLDVLRPNVPGPRIIATDRDVEEMIVVCHERRRPDLRRRVVARRKLEEVADLGRALPAGVVERPVDRDRAGRAKWRRAARPKRGAPQRCITAEPRSASRLKVRRNRRKVPLQSPVNRLPRRARREPIIVWSVQHRSDSVSLCSSAGLRNTRRFLRRTE